MFSESSIFYYCGAGGNTRTKGGRGVYGGFGRFFNIRLNFWGNIFLVCIFSYAKGEWVVCECAVA